MKELKKSELKEIVGGLNISGPIITALSNTIKTIYDIGRNLGGALRRIKEGRVCKL